MIDFSNYCISASRALNYPTENLIPRQSGQDNKHRSSGEWFQDVWAEKLTKKGHKPIQTVFTGMPSTGKSTELKRLAVELNKKTVNTHHVVHLFLIQNDFSSGTGIYNMDDLWSAIMRCHASEKIRENPQSIDEFIELHQQNQSQPILLIDTLDVLPYGVVAEKQEPLVEIWRLLVERLVEANIHTIWTCRTMEADLFTSNHVSTQRIPRLHASSVESLVRDTPHVSAKVEEENKANNARQPVLPPCILSIHGFPILAQFFGTQEKRFFPYDEYFDAMFKLYFYRMHYAIKPPAEANPISWAMELQDQMLPVDVMYQVLRDKVIDYLKEDGLGVIEDKPVEEHWRDLIEEAFFRVAIYNPNHYGSRLLIPRKTDNESPEITRLKSEIFYLGEKLGLFALHPNKVAFTHQLFAEYCLFKGIQKKNLNHDELEEFLWKFPSLRIKFLQRTLQSDVDPRWESEYTAWVSPYVAACPLFNFPRLKVRGKKWQQAIRLSKKSYGKLEGARTHENEQVPTPQQDEILTNLPSSPLFINGPAGTGKTHMAPWFIHERMNELSNSDSGGGEKPSYGVNFFTMSPYLADHFETKWTEYQSGILDNFVPLIYSRSVDQLLIELLEVIGGDHLAAIRYGRSLLTESKFIRLLRSSRNALIGPLLNRYSSHGLWNEYTKNIISKDGRPAETIEKYRKNLMESEKKRKKHGKNLGPNSIFYDFNEKGDQRSNGDSGAFFTILESMNLAGSRVQLKTRQQFAKELSERVSEIHHKGTVEMRERLLQFTSEVTVVDEIQDLHPCIIELLLLLHAGDVSTFMAMGDEDQTLDYEVFSWKEFLGDLDKLKDNWNTTPSHETEKWKACSFSSIEIHYLQDVERSVPSIVSTIQNAYKTAVSVEFSLEPGIGRGTAATKPGLHSYARAKGYVEKYPPENIGVSLVDTPITKIQLINLIRNIYNGKMQSMVIFPSSRQHEEWSLDFEKKYPIPLWHPVSVKGLESDVVIALAPWSIDKKMLDNVLAQYTKDYRSADWGGGNGLEEVAKKRRKKNPSFGARFENVVSQRRRHGNVMISRAKRHLVVIPMVDDDFDMIASNAPSLFASNSEDIKKITLSNLFELMEYQVKDHESGKATWYSELDGLIKFLIQLVQSDSDGHLLRNISLNASHILYAADDNAPETQKIRPVMWALQKMRTDADTLALELSQLGFDSKFGNELVSIPALMLTEQDLSSLPDIKEITDVLYKASKTVVLNYDEQNILVPFSTNDIVKTSMNSLVSIMSNLSLPPDADVKPEGLDALRQWIEKMLLPAEFKSSPLEEWKAKLSFYDFDKNLLRIPLRLAPTLNHPDAILRLFWESPRAAQIKIDIKKHENEIKKAKEFVKSGGGSEEDLKDFVEIETDKIDQLEKDLQREGGVKHSVPGYDLLISEEGIQDPKISDPDKNNQTLISEFWSGGLELLREVPYDSNYLHDLWTSQQMKLDSAEIKFDEQLNTFVFLSTSILKQDDFKPSEFIEALGNLNLMKGVKSLPIEEFLPSKLFPRSLKNRIKSSIIRSILVNEKSAMKPAIALMNDVGINSGELSQNLNENFPKNLYHFSRYTKFVSLVRNKQVVDDFVLHSTRNGSQLLMGDAMPATIENSVNSDIGRAPVPLANILVGKKEYSQFRTITDFKTLVKSLKDHPTAISIMLSTLLIRLNHFADLIYRRRGIVWSKEFELLDAEIDEKVDLSGLIKKYLVFEDLRDVLSSPDEEFESDVADYMRLFTQIDEVIFDEDYNIKRKEGFTFFTEMASRWDIGKANERNFQNIEKLSLPLSSRAASEFRRIIDNPKEQENRNILEEAGFLNARGQWIGGRKPKISDKNYYSESEVSKIIARHMYGKVSGSQKSSDLEKFEHIQKFINDAKAIMAKDVSDPQANNLTTYRVRFGRHHSSPTVNLNQFFGLTEVLATLKRCDFALQIQRFGANKINENELMMFDDVFTLQNLFKHLVREVIKVNKSNTTITKVNEAFFFRIIKNMFKEIEKGLAKGGHPASLKSNFMDEVKLRLVSLGKLQRFAINGCVAVARDLSHQGENYNLHLKTKGKAPPVGSIFVGNDEKELVSSDSYVSFDEFLQRTQFTDMRTTRLLRSHKQMTR